MAESDFSARPTDGKHSFSPAAKRSFIMYITCARVRSTAGRLIQNTVQPNNREPIDFRFKTHNGVGAKNINPLKQ
jgi:hypothetical protein